MMEMWYTFALYIKTKKKKNKFWQRLEFCSNVEICLPFLCHIKWQLVKCNCAEQHWHWRCTITLASRESHFRKIHPLLNSFVHCRCKNGRDRIRKERNRQRNKGVNEACTLQMNRCHRFSWEKISPLWETIQSQINISKWEAFNVRMY